MRKLIFGFVIISIIGCNFHEQRKNDAAKALNKANQSLATNHHDSLSVTKAREAVESFVRRFPEDSLSPAFLFQLALVYENAGEYDSTVKTLERVYSYYPLSKQASKAVFLQGFVYSFYLKQYDLAKTTYQLYLDKYSSVDAKMTSDAKFEIEHMGKSPDEVLEELQMKAKKDSTQAP